MKHNAVEMACISILGMLDNDGGCWLCPLYGCCNIDHDYNKCLKLLIKYFNEQATASDGWDIVKEIVDYLEIWNDQWNKMNEFKYHSKEEEKGRIKALNLFIKDIKEQLHQAGMEEINDD